MSKQNSIKGTYFDTIYLNTFNKTLDALMPNAEKIVRKDFSHAEIAAIVKDMHLKAIADCFNDLDLRLRKLEGTR
jgi:hypothetical protein